MPNPHQPKQTIRQADPDTPYIFDCAHQNFEPQGTPIALQTLHPTYDPKYLVTAWMSLFPVIFYLVWSLTALDTAYRFATTAITTTGNVETCTFGNRESPRLTVRYIVDDIPYTSTMLTLGQACTSFVENTLIAIEYIPDVPDHARLLMPDHVNQRNAIGIVMGFVAMIICLGFCLSYIIPHGRAVYRGNVLYKRGILIEGHIITVNKDERGNFRDVACEFISPDGISMTYTQLIQTLCRKQPRVGMRCWVLYANNQVMMVL